MIRSARWIHSILLLIATSTFAYAQGESGFLRGQGNLDAVFSYSKDFPTETFDFDASKTLNPGEDDVDRTTYTLSLLYGLRDDLDLNFHLSHGTAVGHGTGGYADRESDFQDAVVMGKWRFYEFDALNGRLSFLAAPGLKFPVGGYEDTGPTALGDKQTDYRARGIAHYHDATGFFAALEAGYDLRQGSPKDEVPLHITAGYTLWNRFSVLPFASYIRNLDGLDYGRYGIGGYLKITDQFGLYGNYRVSDYEQTPRVPGFSVSGIVRF